MAKKNQKCSKQDTWFSTVVTLTEEMGNDAGIHYMYCFHFLKDFLPFPVIGPYFDSQLELLIKVVTSLKFCYLEEIIFIQSHGHFEKI